MSHDILQAKIFIHVAQLKNICNGWRTGCWCTSSNHEGSKKAWKQRGLLCLIFSSIYMFALWCLHNLILNWFSKNSSLWKRKRLWSNQSLNALNLKEILTFPVQGKYNYQLWISMLHEFHLVYSHENYSMG